MWDLQPAHSEAARHLLKWDRARLARESGVSDATIGRFERNEGGTHVSTLRKLVRAFENAGIVFENVPNANGAHFHGEDGVRVRLKRSS